MGGINTSLSMSISENVTELTTALNSLRNSSSQSNTKGEMIRRWFRSRFGKEAAVSKINENKQIGNRFKEQIGKEAPHSLFLFSTKDTLERSKTRIADYAYSSMEAIYFFYWDGATYTLETVYSNLDPHSLKQFVGTAFGFSTLLPLPASVSASKMKQSTTEQPHRNPDKGLVWPDKPYPDSGLVGLDGVVDQVLASLLSGKHVILIGPPGVAKTELSEYICRLLSAPFTMTTATSEWTTADTIGTYTSTEAGLDFEPGIIAESIEKNEWLIIDEFNRAQIDKAFGELFTVFSGKTVALPYKKRFGAEAKRVILGSEASEGCHLIELSKSWRMIASMNSFDKASLDRLSLALMRRFSVVYVQPPLPEDYRKLLIDAADGLLIDVNHQSTFNSAVEKLVDLFSGHQTIGFRAIGIDVGPAIPLDAVKYIEQRLLDKTDLEARLGSPIEPFLSSA